MATTIRFAGRRLSRQALVDWATSAEARERDEGEWDIF